MHEQSNVKGQQRESPWNGAKDSNETYHLGRARLTDRPPFEVELLREKTSVTILRWMMVKPSIIFVSSLGGSLSGYYKIKLKTWSNGDLWRSCNSKVAEQGADGETIFSS